MAMWIGLIILGLVLLVVLRRQAEAPARNFRERPGSSPTPYNMEKRHQDAVRYIEQSGDSFANKQLNAIRHRPEAFNYYFCKYADENATLKTAFGLLAGYLAWELLTDDNRQDELAAAMARLDSDLENDAVPWEGTVDEMEQFTEDSDGPEEDKEMDRLYADLDDTQYFEDMMDD